MASIWQNLFIIPTLHSFMNHITSIHGAILFIFCTDTKFRVNTGSMPPAACEKRLWGLKLIHASSIVPTQRILTIFHVGIFLIIIKLEPRLGPWEWTDIVDETFLDESFEGLLGRLVSSLESLLETRFR